MVPVLGPSSSLSSLSLGWCHNVEVPLLLPLLLRGCIEARSESVTIIMKSHYVHFWYFPTQSHVTDKKLAGSIAFSGLMASKSVYSSLLTYLQCWHLTKLRHFWFRDKNEANHYGFISESPLWTDIRGFFSASYAGRFPNLPRGQYFRIAYFSVRISFLSISSISFPILTIYYRAVFTFSWTGSLLLWAWSYARLNRIPWRVS